VMPMTGRLLGSMSRASDADSIVGETSRLSRIGPAGVASAGARWTGTWRRPTTHGSAMQYR
jgi:hypothetical protein